MKVIIDLPLEGSFEATVTAYDVDGAVIKPPARIELVPMFYSNVPLARMLHCETQVIKGGKPNCPHSTSQRAVLVANGRTGKIGLQDRTSPVVAACDVGATPSSEKKG